MTDWFLTLDTQMQIYWGCAMVASLFFIIQTIAVIVGIGDGGDFDIGADAMADTSFWGEAVEMLSLRNLINFLMGFGWAGVCLRGTIANDGLLIVAALLVGLLFVALFVLVMRKTKLLEHNGAMDTEKDVIGKAADVYLRIPADGIGKIQLSVNGAVHEFNAVADEEIPTGAKVKVIRKETAGTYRVAR